MSRYRLEIVLIEGKSLARRVSSRIMYGGSMYLVWAAVRRALVPSSFFGSHCAQKSFNSPSKMICATPSRKKWTALHVPPRMNALACHDGGRLGHRI